MVWNSHIKFSIIFRAAAVLILSIQFLVANNLAVDGLAMADQLVHTNCFVILLLDSITVFVDLRNLNLFRQHLGILLINFRFLH